MDYLEGLFGVDTFNKKVVTSAVGEYLKYMQDVYRRSLAGNPRYEHPPSIPERVWKVIIDDVVYIGADPGFNASTMHQQNPNYLPFWKHL